MAKSQMKETHTIGGFMLELKNVSFSADEENGKKEILKNISLKIDERFVAITGPNGGGKSTLAKIIAGILTPSEGKIILDGEDITGLSITERAQKGVSFAFQQPVRFKGITVRDLITLAAGKKIGLTEACEYLSEVGLCARDYINREVNASLSGGELKRIEIATILARGTKLSVFDEPEAGIDLWSFGNLIKVFENMHKKINGSIIIISHQERILNIADKIIVLADGQIDAIGKKEEIMPRLLGESAVCKTLADKL
jgi:Fe-S cluster assembly ATP-binding protein